MKNFILIIVVGIFLISVSAAMYAGESQTFDMEFEIVNCSIINNTNNLTGLNLTWENTNVTISTVVNYMPDSFLISCFVIKYEEIVEHCSSSSSSSCSYKKDFDWECSEWGECINGTQTRTCKEYNNCHNIYGKPNLTKTCIMPVNDTDPKIDLDEPEPEEPGINWIGLSVISLLLLLTSFVIYRKIKSKGEKRKEQKDRAL